MKKVLNTLLVVLVGLLIITSCSIGQNVADELVSVKLTTSDRTRALVAGVDFDIATVSSWKYTAVKADSGLKTGETGTGETNAVALTNGNTKALSQGSWNFELFGYNSGNKLVCSGSVANATVTVDKHEVKITVKPSQTENGKGNIVISDDIQIVGSDGTAYSGSEYTKVVVVTKDGGTASIYDSSSEDKKETSLLTNIASGLYKLEVTYKATAKDGETTYTAATGTKYINVYDNLTTTVSGTIEETAQAAALKSELGVITAKAEQTVTVNDKKKNTAAVTLDVASTPTGTSNNTSVSFPAGALTVTDTNNKVELTVATASVETANSSDYQVTASEGNSVVAGFDFTLTGAESTDFGTAGVQVTTVIATGLDASTISIKYDGTSTGTAPKFGSYNSKTGELTFTVYHFSKYFVETSGIVAYDEASLKAAIESAESKSTITLLKDIELTSAFTLDKTLTIDFNNKTIKIASSFGGYAFTLPDADEAYAVTFKNGNITGGTCLGPHIFVARTNSTLTLDSMKINANCMTGIQVCEGSNPVKIVIRDTVLNLNGGFGFSTNATYGTDYVDIEVTNSTIKTSNVYCDNTGMLINVPAKVTIKNSLISGERQGLIIRSTGVDNEVAIINSTIESTGNQAASGYFDHPSDLTKWGAGNRVPLAALVIGNTSTTAYMNGTKVTLENVKLNPSTTTNDRISMYVYQASADYPVSVSGTVEGSYVINDADTMNGATVNLTTATATGN